MNRKLEKRIYECLGVLLFRDKILFSLEKIANKLNINMKYRIDKYNLDSLKKYKKDAKDTGWGHFWSMILGAPILLLVFYEPISLIIFIVLNIYSIMMQRYNIIRIDELIERLEKKAIKSVPLEGKGEVDSKENGLVLDSTKNNNKSAERPKFAFDPQNNVIIPTTEDYVDDRNEKGLNR